MLIAIAFYDFIDFFFGSSDNLVIIVFLYEETNNRKYFCPFTFFSNTIDRKSFIRRMFFYELHESFLSSLPFVRDRLILLEFSRKVNRRKSIILVNTRRVIELSINGHNIDRIFFLKRRCQTFQSRRQGLTILAILGNYCDENILKSIFSSV